MVTKPLAWAITGGGHYLNEVFGLMLELSPQHRITCFVSGAAEEVVKIYGLWERLREISDGSHYCEVFTDRSDGSSAIHAGRLSRGVYSALIVAPATANTVAKTCLGVADTLVTNAVAQALKGGCHVLILPTDQSETVETTLPIRVESSLCVGCDPCPARESCQVGAFTVREGRGAIDYLKCIGCDLCLKACPEGAVRYGEKLLVKARKVDLENVERLLEMEGITVLRDPGELREALKGSLGRGR